METFSPAAFGTSPPTLISPSNEEEVTTIFVIGFPDDFTEREFINMFTFAGGFECATLKRHERKQLIGFAKFESRHQAEEAVARLTGRRVDPDAPSSLKAEMAKKNLHISKRGAVRAPATDAPPATAHSDRGPQFEPSMISPPPLQLSAMLMGASAQQQQQQAAMSQPGQQQQPQARKAPGAGRPSDWPAAFEASLHIGGAGDGLFGASTSSSSMSLGALSSQRFGGFERGSAEDFYDQFHAAPLPSTGASTSSSSSTGSSSMHRFGFDMSMGGGATASSSSSMSSSNGTGAGNGFFGNLGDFHNSSSSSSSSSLYGGNASTGSSLLFGDAKWHAAGSLGSGAGTSSTSSGHGTSAGAGSFGNSSTPQPAISLTNGLPYGGMGPPNAENPPCNTLYVGNLPPNTPAEELRHLFSSCPGYKRLSFQNKANGAMCFVEFEDIAYATHAMHRLHGVPLSTSTRGGIRLSYAKNSLGMRQSNSTAQPNPVASYSLPPLYGGNDPTAYGKHRVMAM